METMDAKTREANLKAYADQIAKPTGNEVLVHVVEGCTMWWGPTPRLHKLHRSLEEGGENFMVPEHVFLNSNFHNPKKSVNGAIIRGVLERADYVKPGAADHYSDDLRTLMEQNDDLRRKLAAATGQAPPAVAPVPLVVPDAPAKGNAKAGRKSEEI